MPILGQTENPVEWEFSSNKKSDNTYEVALIATISKPWHIYSQFTPEGGPVPTKIKFLSNPLLKIEEKILENGKLESHHDQTFDVEVKYFSNQVAFVQTLKKRGSIKTNIRGNIEYMVCNDVMCLPPVKKPFDIKIQ